MERKTEQSEPLAGLMNMIERRALMNEQAHEHFAFALYL